MFSDLIIRGWLSLFQFNLEICTKYFTLPIFEIVELPLSNNSVEQSIRPSTIIRKNSLFAKSTAGAEANAIFYTIVQTAKLNNLDVFKYLKLIFEAYTRSQNLDLKAYLPWNPTVQQICGK